MNPSNSSQRRISSGNPRIISNLRFVELLARWVSSVAHPRSIATALVGAFILATALSTLLSRTTSVSAFAATIDSYASDCQTLRSTFSLGDTVCAQVTGPVFLRRVVWADPNGVPVRTSPFITTDPFTDSFAIPSSPDSVGTWTLRLVNTDGDAIAKASFVVRDTAHVTADLSVVKWTFSSNILAGGNVLFRVYVTNVGPDAAANVVLTDQVPANTSFVSESQDAGPAFTCSTTGGITTCTRASLAAGETALFTFIYTIDSGTAVGTTISNTATASTDTTDRRPDDNSSSALVTVSGVNTAPCSITCPADITTNNDANQCTAVVTYTTPTSSGNCQDPDTGLTQPVVCSPASGSPFPVGSTEVICATGATTCSFTVEVNDTRPPVQPTLNCPSNVTTDESSTDPGSAIVDYAPPTTTGNCVTVVCSPPSGSTFPVGITTVTCNATDSANNSLSCSFTVTVNSSTGGGCTLTCPGDITPTASPGECSAVVTYSPTTSANCTATCTPASGSTFQTGTTTVTCSVAGGPSCEFTVTVVPASPPTITTCATDKTISANASCEATVPNLVGEVTATGCNVTKSQSPAAGTIVGPGTVTVVITAENTAGEVSCSATVTVLNTITPTITCPADISTSNDNGQCGAVVTYTAPSSTNPCSNVTVSCLPASGSFFSIGATNVICTATDVSGITATCTFNVTVTDTQSPTITCPPNVTHDNDQDQCNAVINYASPTAADNCAGVSTNCTPAAGTQFAVGTTTVSCTATDAAGLTATCSFTVTINDTQAPKITCPSNIAVGTDPNSSTAAVTYQPTASDNCSGVTSSCTPPSGSQFAVGTATVNCTATDAGGFTASCSFTVTVSDNQPPTITCPASIPNKSNDPNQCGAVVTYANPTVTDNQPGATSSCTPASGVFFPVGVTTVTCTATDAGGNHSSCSFAVTVRDTQLPAISCPANITASNTAGLCSATVNPGVATAADNCTGVTVVGARNDGLALNAAYPVGTTTIIWTARDAAGNQVSCTQTIVVNDTHPPVITGAAANPSTLWPPNHKLVDVTISYSLADNCSASSQITSALSITSNEGTSADWQIVDAHHVKLRSEREGGGNGRIYTITITSTDTKGNTSTQTVTVTVPHNH